MKTKELITLLQKEDPSGEAFVRINGNEVIWNVEGKEGYWDGPYNYIKKGNDRKYTWFSSTKGSKVDIITMNLIDFVEMHNCNWEEIEKHIIVDYDYCDNGKSEKEFLNCVKNAYEEMHNNEQN